MGNGNFGVLSISLFAAILFFVAIFVVLILNYANVTNPSDLSSRIKAENTTGISFRMENLINMTGNCSLDMEFSKNSAVIKEIKQMDIGLILPFETRLIEYDISDMPSGKTDFAVKIDCEWA